MNSKRYDSAPVKRAELHLHTKMSAMDAVTDIAEVICRALEWGHRAIAITDHGVAQAFPEAMRAAGDKIKVLYGLEGYFFNDVEKRQPAVSGINAAKHITILAKNQVGIKNLYKIITKSHLEHYHNNPVIPKSVLMEYREGLIIGSACELGEVFSLMAENDGRLEQRGITDLYDYFEIMPAATDETRGYNRKIVELGAELGKPVCATGDVHFIDPEDEIFRSILLTAKGYETSSVNPLYFRTTGEMLEEFSYLGKEKAYEVVVTNTNLIADLCDTVTPLPPKDKLFLPKLKNSAEELKSLVNAKMCELYGETPPSLITGRVESEMKIILDNGYDVIYMTAQKLVADSIEHGYSVGSRGSVGASVVAYLAGVTEINPLPAHYRCPNCRHTDFESGGNYGCGADMPDALCPACGEKYEKDGFDIPFETFLGLNGEKKPDIDFNFSDEYQAIAHRYTMALFGNDHVFKAGTIVKVAEKTALAFVQKYSEKTGQNFSSAEAHRLALGCVGVKRTSGQHPGGLVIIPHDMEITDFCPAQHPADDRETEIITTHFEYSSMEHNLLKVDELRHDAPAMLKLLEELTGVNPCEIPLDDKDTLSIFSSLTALRLPVGDEIVGETDAIGIPGFDTRDTLKMLSEIKPDNFDALVRVFGLLHGKDVWIGNAKDIITSGTAGVDEIISCREDIMLRLISGGMRRALAYEIMGRIRKGYGLSHVFEDAMCEIGIPEWYIESCKKIKYLFPKAHAVSYVLMAFRIAWFKVHRPLEFSLALCV